MFRFAVDLVFAGAGARVYCCSVVCALSCWTDAVSACTACVRSDLASAARRAGAHCLANEGQCDRMRSRQLSKKLPVACWTSLLLFYQPYFTNECWTCLVSTGRGAGDYLGICRSGAGSTGVKPGGSKPSPRRGSRGSVQAKRWHLQNKYFFVGEEFQYNLILMGFRPKCIPDCE